MNQRAFFVGVFFGALGVLVMGGAASAQDRVLRAVGVPLTGPNDRCGEPVWTLNGVPAGPESRGTFLGLKDDSAGAIDALPLASADCDDPADSRRLATTFDDDYALARGWPDPDAQLLNRTLRSVPVPAGNGVRAVIPEPGALPPNPLPPTISRPTDPIQLGHWLSAAGELEIACDDVAGTATIDVEVHHLVPNGVYTLWGAWASFDAFVVEAPIGGLPNTAVATPQGDVTIFRAIDFCPLDLAPNGSELQYISLAYHADTTTYGAVPYEAFTTRVFVGLGGAPFVSTIPGGVVTFDAVGFRVNAVGGPDPGPEEPPADDDLPPVCDDGEDPDTDRGPRENDRRAERADEILRLLFGDLREVPDAGGPPR